MPLSYSVTATLPDPATRDEYLAWLAHGHVQQVVAAGALDAAILVLDEPATPLRVQTRYTFSDRAAFDLYVRDHAPALRADGLAKFPPHRNVTFTREISTIYLSHSVVPSASHSLPR